MSYIGQNFKKWMEESEKAFNWIKHYIYYAAPVLQGGGPGGGLQKVQSRLRWLVLGNKTLWLRLGKHLF